MSNIARGFLIRLNTFITVVCLCCAVVFMARRQPDAFVFAVVAAWLNLMCAYNNICGIRH